MLFAKKTMLFAGNSSLVTENHRPERRGHAGNGGVRAPLANQRLCEGVMHEVTQRHFYAVSSSFSISAVSRSVDSPHSLRLLHPHCLAINVCSFLVRVHIAAASICVQGIQDDLFRHCQFLRKPLWLWNAAIILFSRHSTLFGRYQRSAMEVRGDRLAWQKQRNRQFAEFSREPCGACMSLSVSHGLVDFGTLVHRRPSSSDALSRVSLKVLRSAPNICQKISRRRSTRSFGVVRKSEICKLCTFASTLCRSSQQYLHTCFTAVQRLC